MLYKLFNLISKHFTIVAFLVGLVVVFILCIFKHFLLGGLLAHISFMGSFILGTIGLTTRLATIGIVEHLVNHFDFSNKFVALFDYYKTAVNATLVNSFSMLPAGGGVGGNIAGGANPVGNIAGGANPVGNIAGGANPVGNVAGGANPAGIVAAGANVGANPLDVQPGYTIEVINPIPWPAGGTGADAPDNAVAYSTNRSNQPYASNMQDSMKEIASGTNGRCTMPDFDVNARRFFCDFINDKFPEKVFNNNVNYYNTRDIRKALKKLP